ncbi:Phosphoserine aminotransferase [Smittium mucronatum]|uniref:phosphoserine transaminase n=1 Tax=Smittium mucronatum TaxID=133383 RepID=A0A1R0H736_9FUNG|nr:Phosphoserine aminotransferase [Smittium mucronatum]
MQNQPPNFRANNFSAGPSSIPEEVLTVVQRDLFNFDNTGISVMEMSHRSKSFTKVFKEAEEDFRKLYDVPDNYYVLFMQGGGTGEFAAVYLNLINSKVIRQKQRDSSNPLKCAYIVSGSWSKLAKKECERLGGQTHLIVDCQDSASGKYLTVPPVSDWDILPTQDLAYVYYCDNETIGGLEFESDSVYPHFDNSVPIVCDISSNALTRKVDFSKFGIVYAGAQKNMGPSGLTVVVVRKDLVERDSIAQSQINPLPGFPSVLDYKYFVDGGFMPHTPTTFSIYVCGLVFKYILQKGGVDEMNRLSVQKSSLFYNLIDSNPQFLNNSIDKRYRSRLNCVFTLTNPSLDSKLLQDAANNNFFEIKGHRSTGGFRASFYNAITVNQVSLFVEFLSKFIQENS